MRERWETYSLRRRLVLEYAWAVPTEGALRRLLELGPIVEVGAGGGYWAMLLRERGGDVLALDRDLEPNYQVERRWDEVRLGGPRSLRRVDGRALFLCWPPYETPMAYRALVRFRGDVVAYIGETEGGCNATDQFFAELERRFEQEDEVAVPQWPGIHDYLSVWRRREEGPAPATGR